MPSSRIRERCAITVEHIPWLCKVELSLWLCSRSRASDRADLDQYSIPPKRGSRAWLGKQTRQGIMS